MPRRDHREHIVVNQSVRCYDLPAIGIEQATVKSRQPALRLLYQQAGCGPVVVGQLLVAVRPDFVLVALVGDPRRVRARRGPAHAQARVPLNLPGGRGHLARQQFDERGLA